MTRLEELIYSLATVIVRYHDAQRVPRKLVDENDPTVLKEKSRESAKKIIQNTEVNFDIRLKELIVACTADYADRKPFLSFLLHEITFLKAQLDRKVPYSPEELGLYRQQIIQLLLDFQQLLKVSKDKVFKVTHSSFTDEPLRIELNGLMNNSWFENSYCNSGLLIMDEVLDKCRLSIKSSPEAIKNYAYDLCEEHEKTLPNKENLRLKEELQQKEETAEKEKAQREKAEKENLELKEKLKELEETAEREKTAREKLEKEKSEIEAQLLEKDTKLQEAEEKNKTQQVIINELQNYKKSKEEEGGLIRRYPVMAPAYMTGLAGILQQRGATNARFFPIVPQITPSSSENVVEDETPSLINE